MVFQLQDFVVIGTLIVLEGLLSADNALILALLVRHLPQEQQKKALLYGLVGAFTLRGIFIALASFIIKLWWLCGLGALYLVFLAVKHFLAKNKHEDDEASAAAKVGMGFWQTVAVVEFTDIVFAIDSILVAVALVNDPSKIWIVYVGGFLGIVLLRLAAGFFIKLIQKYPSLDNMAYALVGWAGVKLGAKAYQLFLESTGLYTHETVPQLLPQWLFWSVMAVIVAVGVWSARRSGPITGDEDISEALEDLDESGLVEGAGGAKVYETPAS